jgi:hypothetical protein
MMVLTILNWDGCTMGRTIALKLSEKEDEIVTQFNKLGMSNSELLRAALRQYFEQCNMASNPDHQIKNIFPSEENIHTDVSGPFNGLKQEVQDLQEQMKRTENQIEHNITKLQRQIDLLLTMDPFLEQVSSAMKFDVINDIHHEIDEFLKKRP